MNTLFLTTAAVGMVTLGAACATIAPPDAPAPAETDALESAEAPTTDSKLLTYDGPAEGIPVSAQYPDTMEVMGTGSGEGVGVFFTFKPQGNALDDAEVSVFLPAGVSSTDDLMEFITGPNGLIENNQWTLDGSRSDTATEFAYPWVEMVLDISTDFEQSGHILIGESNGQAIQVVILYPAEMADEFWPAAETVLESMTFDDELLPVTTSEPAA